MIEDYINYALFDSREDKGKWILETHKHLGLERLLKESKAHFLYLVGLCNQMEHSRVPETKHQPAVVLAGQKLQNGKCTQKRQKKKRKKEKKSRIEI